MTVKRMVHRGASGLWGQPLGRAVWQCRGDGPHSRHNAKPGRRRLPADGQGLRLRAADDRAAAGTAAAGPDARPPDIYIPRKWTGDAASGDVVLVGLHRRRAGGEGPRGEIIEVLQRQTRQFVGTYFQSGSAGYVAVDGTLFAQPIAVGDPGARAPGATTKWSSRWSASPRRRRTAKG